VVPGLETLPAQAGAAAEQFSRLYARAVADTPDLLPLAGMTNAVLEKNLPVPAMLAFKQGLATGLDMAAASLSQSKLRLERSAGIDLLLRTWSMTLGLWQTLDFPSELRSHLRRGHLQVFDRDFASELRQAVAAIWLGSLTRH
jgi:hypothetical protein